MGQSSPVKTICEGVEDLSLGKPTRSWAGESDWQNPNHALLSWLQNQQSGLHVSPVGGWLCFLTRFTRGRLPGAGPQDSNTTTKEKNVLYN
ncbi:Plasma Membrane Calcium-Transporting Atpase 1 [Manis pentadactyla]|nr:Plasma Membrane Calcium-Transporting Atpase 1 [Manis pentadactyla]